MVKIKFCNSLYRLGAASLSSKRQISACIVRSIESFGSLGFSNVYLCVNLFHSFEMILTNDPN